MKVILKNSSLLILLMVVSFLASGCACNQSKKHGVLKGIAFGVAAGAGVAVLEEEISDDLDPDDDLEIGIAIGALAGGIIGYFMDTCEPEPVAVAKAPVDTDSDGDGVVDRLDQCPDTPRGARVDYKGCPLDSDKDGVYDYADRCPDTPTGVKVDSKGCPLDTDGDGVYDYKDKCPGTPRGTKVDSAGCPLDSDGDGVLNSADRCPDTPDGAKVNERGCWALKGTIFDTNKAVIKAEFQSQLDDVANVLKNVPELKIEIQGHTDSAGSEKYNQTLSEKRANAVKDYLASKGINANRMTAKGYGESMPVASNDTEEGRAANRRATLIPE